MPNGLPIVPMLCKNEARVIDSPAAAAVSVYNPYDPFLAANSLVQQVQAGAAAGGGAAGGLGGHHADPRLQNLAAVAASSLAAAGGNHAASAAAMAAQLNAAAVAAAQGRGNHAAAGSPHGGFGHLAGLPAGLSLQAAVANQAAAAYSAGGLPPGLARDPTAAALADPYLGQSIGPVPGYGAALYRNYQRFAPY